MRAALKLRGECAERRCVVVFLVMRHSQRLETRAELLGQPVDCSTQKRRGCAIYAGIVCRPNVHAKRISRPGFTRTSTDRFEYFVSRDANILRANAAFG